MMAINMSCANTFPALEPHVKQTQIGPVNAKGFCDNNLEHFDKTLNQKVLKSFVFLQMN